LVAPMNKEFFTPITITSLSMKHQDGRSRRNNN